MPDTPASIRQRIAHTTRRLVHINRVRQALRTLQARRRKVLAHITKPPPSVMYDSITLDQIPKDAPAVAGYVSGRWPTYSKLVSGWPTARHLSIAVGSGQDAQCLDVEPGDATPATAVGWVKRQLERGVHKPVVYTSVSGAQALVNLLAAQGVKRSQYRLWCAHYTFRAHICGPGCGFGMRTVADATQWTDKALGRNLDQSLCTRGFWS